MKPFVREVKQLSQKHTAQNSTVKTGSQVSWLRTPLFLLPLTPQILRYFQLKFQDLGEWYPKVLKKNFPRLLSVGGEGKQLNIQKVRISNYKSI